MTNKKNILVLIGALLGNMMEYFDFTVYSMFAVAIGAAFFPDYSADAQLLLSFSIFAVGFFTRPLGGIIFGYIGTKFSKKISLVISSAMMSLATLGIGFMPTYSDIGIYSAYLLVTFRMMQGICVGGEGASVAIYILENIKHYSKGFITGISHASNIAGTVLAAIVGIIIFNIQENLNYQPLQNFNFFFINISLENLWRCAFIFGGSLSFVSMILRIASYQTNDIVNIANNTSLNLNNSATRNTVAQKSFLHIIYHGFSKYYKQILIVICLSGLSSSIIYIAKSYMNIIFAEKYNSFEIGSEYTLIISLMIMFCMPFAGSLNNNITAKRISLYSISIIVIIIPILYMINHQSIAIEYIGLVLYAIMTGFIATASYLFCIKLFPQKKRFFIVSFAYNTGVAIFGGTTPMISAWLIYLTNYSFAPGFYIIFICILLLFALFRFQGLSLFEIEE